ncbi:MAG: zinc ribbon domain-containing protein [Candidatus Odinarchaeota archaeon]
MFISIIILLLLFYLLPVVTSAAYSKNWSSSTNSTIQITISPDGADFQPDQVITFTVTIKAISFASNQDRFHNILVCLRFLNSRYTFYSEEKGYFEIKSVNSQIQTSLQLVVPSAETLGLDSAGLTGHLQYKLDYKEGLILAIDPSYTTNWETISAGKITEPATLQPETAKLQQNALIVLVIAGIIGSLTIALFYANRSQSVGKKPLTLSASVPGHEMYISVIYCQRCGIPHGPEDVFCSNCGDKIN